MAGYSALELPYARPVAHAILESDAFRDWFLAGTKHEASLVNARPVGATQGGLRSKTMTNPWWFNYWCGRDSKCDCRIGSGIETDILLMLDCINGRRLALHIEIKSPGDGLRDGQAESYPRRAACWAQQLTRPRTVLPHHDFLTVLVCGRDIASDPRLSYFDKVVFHDEVAQIIQVYPEPSSLNEVSFSS